MKNLKVRMIIIIISIAFAVLINSMLSDALLNQTVMGNKLGYMSILYLIAVVNFSVGFFCGQIIFFRSKKRIQNRQFYTVLIVIFFVSQIGIVLFMKNILTNPIEVPVIIVKNFNIILLTIGMLLSIISKNIYSRFID